MRPPMPFRTNGEYVTVGKLGADDLGKIVQLRPSTLSQPSDREGREGPAWLVVGELLAITHRANAKSSVLVRVVGQELRLDLGADVEVNEPPDR